MSKTSLQINFTPSVSSVQEDLILEQKEWNPGTGYVTKLAFMKFVGMLIYGEDSNNGFGESISCELDDENNFNTTIYVYPFNPNMIYSIATTHGLLGEPQKETIDKHEVISMKLSDDASLKYPLVQLKDIGAVGDLYDKNGNLISINNISITVVGTNIKLSQKVYGSIGIVYSTTRHTYNLKVMKRSSEDTTENFYSAIVYAWWNGGVKWLEITPPPGAEERAGNPRGCGHGKTSISGPGPVKNRPVAAYADRKVVVDYCSLEVLNDSIYPDVDWENVNQ